MSAVGSIAAVLGMLAIPCSARGAALALGEGLVSGPVHVVVPIDGRSRLVFEGDQLWWEHFEQAAPGRLGCNLGVPAQPTLLYYEGASVTNLDWFPVWPDVPDCENRDCGCASQPVTGNESFPGWDASFSLYVGTGRGEVFIAEWPTAANGYRLAIEFDDTAFAGDDQYYIVISFSCANITSFCASNPNASGQAASIGLSGSWSIAHNQAYLRVQGCPPGCFGLFVYGNTATQIPFGNGYLCISPLYPGLMRLPTSQVIGPDGSASQWLDFTSLPPEGEIQAYDPRIFQFWFRDPLPGGSGSNLSDAIRVEFCP